MIEIAPDLPVPPGSVQCRVRSDGSESDAASCSDPVREAIAYAIRKAADEGRWDVVAMLTGKLDTAATATAPDTRNDNVRILPTSPRKK